MTSEVSRDNACSKEPVSKGPAKSPRRAVGVNVKTRLHFHFKSQVDTKNIQPVPLLIIDVREMLCYWFHREWGLPPVGLEQPFLHMDTNIQYVQPYARLEQNVANMATVLTTTS